jgi:hypothetical protein
VRAIRCRNLHKPDRRSRRSCHCSAPRPIHTARSKRKAIGPIRSARCNECNISRSSSASCRSQPPQRNSLQDTWRTVFSSRAKPSALRAHDSCAATKSHYPMQDVIRYPVNGWRRRRTRGSPTACSPENHDLAEGRSFDRIRQDDARSPSFPKSCARGGKLGGVGRRPRS